MEKSELRVPAFAAPRFAVSSYTLLAIACLPIFVFLLGPILIIVPMAMTSGEILMFPPEGMSGHAFVDLFRDAQWVASAITSLKVALLATLIAVMAGTGGALALHRNAVPARGFLSTLIMLPLLVPVIVLALADYLFSSSLNLGASWTTIAFAHSVVVTPYVFVSVQTSLAGLDPALHRAARSLGGTTSALFVEVYLPEIRTGMLGGAIFAFIGSFDEVVIALFLSGPNAVTLPVQMFTAIQFDLSPKIAAVSTVLLAVSFVALIVNGYQSLSRPKTVVS
jgi:putative spermidine/putrescine transport system permease protein